MRVWGFASGVATGVFFGRTRSFEENAWKPVLRGHLSHMSLRTAACTRGPRSVARSIASSARGARRRPSTVGRIRGSTGSTVDEGARAMENSRGRSAGRAGTSGDGSAERPDVAFARSKLSEDVRDMLWVPHEAEDPSFGRDDPDEGWSFDPASGLMDPRASPPATADCDDRTAARALRGLARASLKRIRAGDMTVRDDGAAHANLLSTLMEEIRGGGRTDGPTSTYHALALSLAAVERRCVDLYVSTGGTSRGTSPMLSEVLASEEFSEAIARQRQGRDGEGRRGLLLMRAASRDQPGSARSCGRCDARYTRGA